MPVPRAAAAYGRKLILEKTAQFRKMMYFKKNGWQCKSQDILLVCQLQENSIIEKYTLYY